MKLRTSFISNSSSSSFVCNVCKEEYSGWDLSVSDVDHIDCECGHIICIDSVLPGYNEYKFENDDVCEIPRQYCPVCQLHYVADFNLVEYALIKLGMTNKELIEEIKTKYSKNPEEFYNMINEFRNNNRNR